MNDTAIQLACIALAAVIIVGIVIYTISQNSKNKGCSDLADGASPGGIGSGDATFDDIMGNFYVKSSYNSCATGDWTHGFVDACALSKVISHGCRMLDFEIYDMEGYPVVATSQKVKYGSKNSYNFVPLTAALKIIENEAFSGNINGSDPLFLNFRFATKHISVVDEVANLLTDSRYPTLSSRFLSPQYSAAEVQRRRDAAMKNITQGDTPIAVQDMPLRTLYQKVIIMADFGQLSNRIITSSKLYELVNVCPGDFQSYSYNEMLGMGPADIQAQALNFLAMGAPDDPANAVYKSADPDKITPFSNGVQFCAMNFQTADDTLLNYNKEFASFAFVMKPQTLRRDRNANKVTLPDQRKPAPPVDITTSTGQRIYIPT
jgi:hypothetical protein